MQELPNEPHEHNTDQANQQPQPQLGDSIPLDLKKKETYERLEKFITTFVKEFTKTVNKYRDETTVSLEINTSENVIQDAAVGLIEQFNNCTSIGVRSSIAAVNYFTNRSHKKKAKRVVDVFECIEEDELGNMLAEAGANIFYNYQIQFNMITDTDKYWTRGMEKLAIDATRRVISYINQYKQDNPEMNVSVDLITEGVKLGKYTQGFINAATQKIPKMLKSGHTVKINDKKYKTSEVYENLVKMDDDTAGKYYSEKGNGSNSRKSKDTSGLTQISNEDCQEVIEQPEEEHKYILSLEEVKEKAKETLNKINKEDLQSRIMSEIENVHEKIDKMVGRPESIQVRKSIYYNMKEPVNRFTGRGNELKYLHKSLQNEGRRVVISQVTAVTGLGGIGKSELVRKYAMEYAEHYDNNVIWIDSATHESLTRSFKILAAEELNILISEEINGNMQERQVNFIVKNVYGYFNDVKSLFIFDNAEEYTVIAKFLPTSLHPNAKRPYILITSRNRNWDVDDEGEIHVMELDVFTPEEAALFVKNSIVIEGSLQEGDIEKLTKRLQYFPLVLRQAVAYINQEDKKLSKRGSERYKISDYLKELDENAKKLLDEGYYKISDRYSQTVLTTWVTTLGKIEEDQNHGMKAINILYVMAYLAPDKIHASKMFDSDGIELCDKYSMIDLKKGGVASIHRLVQEVIRLMLKDKNKEEEAIKNALTLIGNNENISKENTSHVTSVWSYASRYRELIREFYFNFDSIPTYGYNNATPLHLLAEDGSDEAVEAILDEAILVKEQFPEKFSDIIDAKDKYNRTPLYMAVENGHASVVKLFVDKGAKIDITSTIVYNSRSTKKASDWTPLHVAAFNGYSDIVEILVNKDEALVDIEDSIGRTAAVLAAFGGEINCLEILNPEPYNVYLLLAKFCAARISGNLHDLENFLENLEEKQLRDIVNVQLGEWTPLHLAAFANWLDITKILIKNGAKVKDITPSFTPLHCASSNGHLAVIKYLIEEEEADPKDINEDGWTSLHAAAQNGHLHVVEYFIDEREIDVDIIDNARATPLHTAAFHGKLNVVEFLLRRGANIKAVNVLGATPLFVAAINNNRDVYDFLLNKDATVVNTSDDQTFIGRLNISVLHVAAVYNDKQMIEDLINKGVDKDIGEGTSLTPLYFATFFDSLEAIEYLIARGATTNARIDISNLRKLLEETVRDSTLESYSIPQFVSTLINFLNILQDDMEISANDLKSIIDKLKCTLVPDFGRLIDSLKIYVEQRKNPGLDLPLHAVFFTQEVDINFIDGDGNRRISSQWSI